MPTLSPKHVLVVDDEPSICDFLDLLLSQDGHTTQTASSGVEALRKFDAQSFDVVLADWRMPGMKGDMLAGEIKKRDEHKPVILITGVPPEDPLQHIDWVIPKPLNLDMLREGLARVCAA